MPEFATGAQIIERLNAERDARIADDIKMQCKICWYVYDPAEGCPEDQTPPGTPFAELPDWWTCPNCGNGKNVFFPFLDVDE